MTRNAAFFSSDDPRPEFTGDPDDPRPEFTGDPDDPRPEFTGDPDDPRPEFTGDPDDPRPEFTGDPDDPRPEFTGDPDDPRPEFTGDPDDPALERALDLLNERHGRRCRRRRRPRCRRRRRPFAYQYSGHIIVRLSEPLVDPTESTNSLCDLAEQDGAGGLKRILSRYDLAGRRLVDLEEAGILGERECRCGRKSCECTLYPTVFQLEQKAETSVLPPRHSLAAYWRIDVRDQPSKTRPGRREMRVNGWEPSHGQTADEIVRELNELVEVDLAYRELAVTDPVVTRDDNTYSSVQEYLDPGPVGINARWARAQMRGTEQGVGLVDLEQGWIPHRDLAEALPPIFGDNRHGQGLYRGHHGTAVLGQIAALDNDEGTLGIAGATRSVRVVSHYDRDTKTSLNVANAIRQAIPKMTPGDVLLLEVQRSLLPTEVDEADRDAIRLAVAHGIVVIEAAGNGNADLDRYLDARGEFVLNRRARGFVDSGAIMVGAALASRPHNRLAGKPGVGSNSGSRVDCFAQGNRVVTTGYGDLNSYLDGSNDVDADDQRAYTYSFGGTSSAAPIIAGAALLIQAIHLDRTGDAEAIRSGEVEPWVNRLSPWEIRNLLSDPANGTRQGRGVRGRIGSMPDLRKILRRRLGLVSDLYLRDHPGDTGDLPSIDRVSASPDIAVLEQSDGPPPVEGEYSGVGMCAPGKDYSVYVRAQNRGADDVIAKSRIYWSEVATLVTPAMWRPLAELGASAGASGATSARVPGGGRPVWSQAAEWRAPASGADASEAATGSASGNYYCFMAMLEDPHPVESGRRDPVAPPGLPPYFDWNEYRAFLREHNNVACRNFHLVDAGGNSRGKKSHEVSFALTGTPDRARRFDFEIIRHLPGSVKVELDAPPALASSLARRRLWKSSAVGTRQARLELPSVPRLRIERQRLQAGARFECGFRISGGGIEAGHSLAIRQLYRGEEVGRITWMFKRPA